jgi:hypothetical protein
MNCSSICVAARALWALPSILVSSLDMSRRQGTGNQLRVLYTYTDHPDAFGNSPGINMKQDLGNGCNIQGEREFLPTHTARNIQGALRIGENSDPRRLDGARSERLGIKPPNLGPHISASHRQPLFHSERGLNQTPRYSVTLFDLRSSASSVTRMPL